MPKNISNLLIKPYINDEEIILINKNKKSAIRKRLLFKWKKLY